MTLRFKVTSFSTALSSSSLDRLRAPRLLPPRSGLERSDLAGRALQAKNDDPEMIGLALLYPARERNCCVPGHHGYPRALDLIRVSAPKAIWAT
jgi:hypothetical protein